MNQLIDLKFLMFENKKNNCWLDASTSLVAHNKTFRKIVDGATKSQIYKIISTHDAAISLLNDSDINIELRMKRTQEMLLEIQTSTLRYLQRFLKHKIGEPDSAFCALLNLIKRDKSNIEECLNANWLWEKLCTNCGNSSRSGYIVKPIITLSKVKSFQPECPTSIYMCQCKTEQEMKLIYKELPSCLIFHFENGAGDEETFPLNFTIKEREYLLTAIVILEKSSDPNLNHFITWVRNPSVNMWLDCNDLNTDIVSFSSNLPECNLKDVYMYVFESFDSLNKIKNEISVNQDKENLNVEVIDLSDEAEEAKHALENKSFKNDKFKNQDIKSEERSAKCAEVNSINNSNMDVPKKEDLMPKEETKLTVKASQNIEMTDKKNHSGITKAGVHDKNVKTENRSVIDYRNVPISNLKCSFPDKQNRDLGAIKRAFDSQLKIDEMKGTLKDEPEKTEVKEESFDVKPFDGNINIENSYDSKIDEDKSVIQSEEGNETKNVASLNAEHSLLNVELPKVPFEQSFKPTLSESIKNINSEDSPSKRRISMQNAAKDLNFESDNRSNILKNLKKEQSARNESKSFSVSNTEWNCEENLQKKQKHSHELPSKGSIEDESVKLADKVSDINISDCLNLQEVMAQSKDTGIHSGSKLKKTKQKTLKKQSRGKKYDFFCHFPRKSMITGISEENEGYGEYNENNSHLKMYQTPLRKSGKLCASLKKKKGVSGANQQTRNRKASTNISKTGVQKLLTSGSRNSKNKTEELQNTSNKEQNKNICVKPIKETCKMLSTEGDCDKKKIASKIKKAADQELQKSTEGDYDKKKTASKIKKAAEQELETIIHETAEKSLASFLHNIFFGPVLGTEQL